MLPQSIQAQITKLQQEKLDMNTRAAEAKKLLATFVYRGIDDPFAKGRLLEDIRKCEFRVKEIETQLKQLKGGVNL